MTGGTMPPYRPRPDAVEVRTPAPCPGTSHGPGPRPGDPVWCSTCTADIQAGLAEIQRMAALVHRNADGYRHNSSGAVPARPGTAGTGDLHMIETLDVLAWELARTYWRSVKITPQAPGTEARTPLGWLMAWERVTAALPAMLRQPTMADYLSRLMMWRSTLARMAGDSETSPEPVKGIRCPACHYVNALVKQVDGSATCVACHAGVSPDRLAALYARS